MKIAAPQYRAVESLGRNNLGSVGSIARAKGAEGAAQNRVASYMAKVGAEFIERKENAEHNTGKTNAMLRIADVEERLGSKAFFTAKEASALPEGAVKLKNTDGSPRNDIPAYEVYPYLFEQAQKKIIEQESEGITNPLLREDFMQLSNGIAAQSNLKNALKAASQQRDYLKKVTVDSSKQLAVKGNRIAALKQVEENPDLTGLERDALNREVNESWEWSEDDRILNSMNLAEIGKRYKYLVEEYGDSELDFLGSGKGSGGYNLESNQKRFKSTIKTLLEKQKFESTAQAKEYIRAAKDGNVEADNPLTSSAGGYEQFINEMNVSEKTKETLKVEASAAVAEGKAMQGARNSTFEEMDSIIKEKERIFFETDAQYRDEAAGTLRALADTRVRAEKELLKDANSRLNRHNPAVQAAQNKVDEQTNPQLKAAAFLNWLRTMRVEQERIGLRPEQVNFLNERDVKTFKDQAQKTNKSPTGASAMLKQIDQLQAQYSDEWPAVYTQLMREGALQPEHIVADNIEDPSLRLEYTQAIEAAPDIEVRQIYKDNITDVKRDAELLLQPLLATSLTAGAMPNNAEGLSVIEQYNALTNGVVKVMMNRVNASGSYDQAELEKLVTKITEDKWEIYDNVRVPRGKDFDVDKTVDGLKLLNNNIKLSPDLVFFTRPVKGISPEDQQALLHKEFLNFNAPQTNSNESGITFKWSTGQPVYVVRDGRAVLLDMPYKDLETLGNKATSTTSSYTRLFNADKWVLE